MMIVVALIVGLVLGVGGQALWLRSWIIGLGYTVLVAAILVTVVLFKLPDDLPSLLPTMAVGSGVGALTCRAIVTRKKPGS